MKCKHCDIEFRRPAVVPIPHDRCTRCHEEMDALGGAHQLSHTLSEDVKMKTNDKNQDSIRNTLVAALNKIREDHGAYITEINAVWRDVSPCGKSKKSLTSLEIEAKL